MGLVSTAIPLLLLCSCDFACKCVFHRPEVTLCNADWAARLHVLSRASWFGRTTYRVESGLFVKHPNTSEFAAPPRRFDVATDSVCALGDLRVGAEYLIAGKYVPDEGFFSFVTRHFRDLSGDFVIDRCQQVVDSKGSVFEWSRLPQRLERSILGRRLNLCWKKPV
ncbi:hypothetical protein QR680_005287 [Steinernema hermaphroditum]|uniref:NTR domain-containing protein n=1 Tax=Steinernema hermaphroditum TaxID=289476 RepID=A0AA39HRG2_9BILA|nr:hypothetical protein QR680_005287 [Steinernema hermaphroditum]